MSRTKSLIAAAACCGALAACGGNPEDPSRASPGTGEDMLSQAGVARIVQANRVTDQFCAGRSDRARLDDAVGDILAVYEDEGDGQFNYGSSLEGNRLLSEVIESTSKRLARCDGAARAVDRLQSALQ